MSEFMCQHMQSSLILIGPKTLYVLGLTLGEGCTLNGRWRGNASCSSTLLTDYKRNGLHPLGENPCESACWLCVQVHNLYPHFLSFICPFL